jgi:hypothetical protein
MTSWYENRSIRAAINAARKAQQKNEQKHDVQQEIDYGEWVYVGNDTWKFIGQSTGKVYETIYRPASWEGDV